MSGISGNYNSQIQSHRWNNTSSHIQKTKVSSKTEEKEFKTPTADSSSPKAVYDKPLSPASPFQAAYSLTNVAGPLEKPSWALVRVAASGSFYAVVQSQAVNMNEPYPDEYFNNREFTARWDSGSCKVVERTAGKTLIWNYGLASVTEDSIIYELTHFRMVGHTSTGTVENFKVQLEGLKEAPKNRMVFKFEDPAVLQELRFSMSSGRNPDSGSETHCHIFMGDLVGQIEWNKPAQRFELLLNESFQPLAVKGYERTASGFEFLFG